MTQLLLSSLFIFSADLIQKADILPCLQIKKFTEQDNCLSFIFLITFTSGWDTVNNKHQRLTFKWIGIIQGVESNYIFISNSPVLISKDVDDDSIWTFCKRSVNFLLVCIDLSLFCFD